MSVSSLTLGVGSIVNALILQKENDVIRVQIEDKFTGILTKDQLNDDSFLVDEE